MILIEETTVPDTALPLEPFKSHLRLGTGFSGDTVQDEVLRSFLRASIAAVEARTGKVLIERGFRWTLTAWRDQSVQVLPVAPVRRIRGLTLTDRGGQSQDVDASAYRFDADDTRPRVLASGVALPVIPHLGEVALAFDAGMSTDWEGLPADLAQAVLMLAAHYYEYRHETSLGDGCMPFGVTSLLQRYRPVRIGFGGGQ